LGNHASRAASWILHISNAARDDVDMHVGHGLAGGGAIVDAYIHRVGIHLGLDKFDRCVDRGAKTLILKGRELREPLEVPLRDHEQVTVGDGVRILAANRRKRTEAFCPAWGLLFLRETFDASSARDSLIPFSRTRRLASGSMATVVNAFPGDR